MSRYFPTSNASRKPASKRLLTCLLAGVFSMSGLVATHVAHAADAAQASEAASTVTPQQIQHQAQHMFKKENSSTLVYLAE